MHLIFPLGVAKPAESPKPNLYGLSAASWPAAAGAALLGWTDGCSVLDGTAEEDWVIETVGTTRLDELAVISASSEEVVDDADVTGPSVPAEHEETTIVATAIERPAATNR